MNKEIIEKVLKEAFMIFPLEDADNLKHIRISVNKILEDKYPTCSDFEKVIEKALQLQEEEIKKKIDEIERGCWDCNSPCGVVNSNADVCKICGVKKETSYDNDKLEELKNSLFGEENKK